LLSDIFDMQAPLRYLIYRNLIDPLIKGLHQEVGAHINNSDNVFDIACGPGSLSMLVAGKARSVTGIDIDNKMISSARVTASRRGLNNVNFLECSASDLSGYIDKAFDVAVISLAVHQFKADIAIQILKEMKRVASRIIIADYNYPMPCGLSKWFAWSIEWLAGGDHYRNFRIFMKKGGLEFFTERAGLKLVKAVVRGKGVLVVRLMT
jgi:SAM-dependent methyltransferase